MSRRCGTGGNGVPDNPPAWLLTAARRRAIDAIRRERTRRTFAADLAKFLDSEWTLATTVRRGVRRARHQGRPAPDDLHVLSSEAAAGEPLTLILKTLCGFSVPAIARALLTTEATVNKRLYRTRRRFGASSSSCPGGGSRRRRETVAHSAVPALQRRPPLDRQEPILRELCRDAMLLDAAPRGPSVDLRRSTRSRLLALMCFNAARLESRLDEEGRWCRSTSRIDRAGTAR